MKRELKFIQSLEQQKGKAAAVFGLKKKVVGSKIEPDAPSVILDPVTKAPIMKPSEIKETCVDYCKNLLTNREPKPEFNEDIEWKRKVHDVRMEERLENDVKYSEEMFTDTLRSIKKKGEINLTLSQEEASLFTMLSVNFTKLSGKGRRYPNPGGTPQ